MKRNVLAVFLVFSLLAVFTGGLCAASTAPAEPVGAAETAVTPDTNPSYADYRAQAGDTRGSGDFVLSAAAYQTAERTEILNEYAGRTGPCVRTDKDSVITYALPDMPAGLYVIEFVYYPLEGTSNAIERRLLLDGRCPFEEAERLVFSRIWGNDGDIRTDARGNESRPAQIETPRWSVSRARDANGLYAEDFAFYLEGKGHTLTLESRREPMLLAEIRLLAAASPPSYRQTAATYTYPPAAGKQAAAIVQAEDASAKSDPTLYPTWDRSSPLTQPMAYTSIKLNTIGGSSWKIAGQWLEWEIDVPADGLYRLGFRARQNVTSGIFSTRRLTIDGALPFAEAGAIRFSYDSDWQFVIPGDGAGDYLFELSAGRHTLRLEAVMGDMGEIIERTDDLIRRLNEAYREILVVTGASPDRFRDYYLDKELPETLAELRAVADGLTAVSARLTALFGERSNQNALLDRLAVQAEQIATRPETVAKTLASFKSNIAALGTWTLGIREQALELDYILLLPEQMEAPAGRSGLFASLWHECKLFFAAFSTDYNRIGYVKNEEEAVKVWVTSGREQATIISQMAAREYTGKLGGPVDLQLVAAGTLLPSVLSGRGPDVALGNTSASVMDFALRGALLPLDDLAGEDGLKDSFYDSALIPLQLEGVQYALPETQVFPMLFYRTDVLETLGIDVPATWDDLYAVLRELQKRHMDFGMPANISGYAVFLYQAGGAFYRDGGRRSALDEDVSVQAFRTFTNLYLNYSLPVAYDFANRFRSGEMPIGVADYSMYNQLTVFAPEISGLWSFAPMIGTRTAEGTIDRSVPGTVTGAMILRTARDPQACRVFLRWWTGAEAQASYAREQESLMGSAARYTVANRLAMERLAWEADQLAVLQRQWREVKAIPEAPGGYYTSRYVDFAFKSVVLQGKEVRETLLDDTAVINRELAAKRREFQLDAGGEEAP